MHRSQRILGFLNIQAGEERLIGLLVLLYFILALAFVFVQSMAFGVFLAEYGPRGLPYSYIANAVLASLAAVLYIKVGERLPFATTLTLNLVFLGSSCLLAWLGLKSPFSHEVSFLLPLLFQIVANLGTLAVWPLAGRILNFQQAKRLFPLLGIGLWLANMIGGLFVSPLVDWIGSVNLLLLAVTSIGLALFVLQMITRTYLRETNPTSQEQRVVRGSRRPAGLFKNRYILLIFAYVTLWWVAFFFLDNIFSDRAAVQYPDVNQLTAFMGQLLSVTGAVALISSTFLAARIISRFGIRAGLISEVVIVACIFVLLVLVGSIGRSTNLAFILAAMAKLITVALGFSLSQAAYAMLFQPLPTVVRGRAQATADGVFQPIASGLTGVVLLALARGLNFDYLRLSYVYLGLVIGLLIIIWVLSGNYVSALTQAITQRRLGESPEVLPDPATIALLKSHLQGSHPGVALYALNQLERLDANTMVETLPKLIQHPAPEVRREALSRIEKLRLSTARETVQKQYAAERIPAVREAALRAIGATGDDASPLIHALHETDIHCLRGALIGLLKYGNEPVAVQRLYSLLGSSSSEDRNLAIEVLGEVNRREFYPHLIAACDKPESSRAAGLALAFIGAEALPEMEIAFRQADAPHRRLLTLARAFGRIGGTQSQTILVSGISTPDHEFRSQILNALSQSNYRLKDSTTIQRAIEAEVELAAWVSAVQIDLHESAEIALLMESLKQFHEQIRNRVLMLLGFVLDRNTIRHVREAVMTGSETQVSYALEIMEVQLPTEWKKIVMPLLEDLSPQERSQRLAVRFPQTRCSTAVRLQEIIANEHLPYWIRACAMYAARKGDDLMLSTVEKVLVLKTVSMFSQTPDNVLADVADLLEEMDVSVNETIFKKGDSGDSMYIIVDGRVRVHTEERLLNYLGESDVFGEMALLDPEPRLASVTTLEPTRLFRLDQSPFYQLMAERPEVAAGIIRVLTRLLRDRVRDLSQLESRIKEFERDTKSTEQESA